jgi:predicted nucleotidyltransferase
MAAPASTPAERAERVLADLVTAAQSALGDTLEAIVLYGSAAEGRLRASSDVNVIFVLTRFEPARIDAFSEAVRVAHAAIQLAPMFLLRDEIPHAATAFSVKFADIVRRHRMLYGGDPFTDVKIPRERLIARLLQVLLNLRLRLRAAYVTQSLFEDQLVGVIADAAGALRSVAASLREIEGQPRLAPREALLEVVESFGEPRFIEAVATMSVARERGVLAPGVPRQTVLVLADLAGRLRDRAARFGNPAS